MTVDGDAGISKS